MRRTKEEATITRGNLLDGALEVFIENGYSQTSVEDIVKRLSLTSGAFYWHFKNKDDLLNQLIFREHTAIADIIAKASVQDSDERNKVRAIMLNLVNSFYDNKRYRNFVYLVRFSLEFKSTLFYFKGLKGLNEFIMDEIEKILSAAKQEGRISQNIDSVGTAVHISSLLDGMFRLYFAVPKYLSKKETAIKIVEDYIKLLFEKK